MEGDWALEVSAACISSAHSGSSLPPSRVECDMEEKAQVEDSDLGLSPGAVLLSTSCVTAGDFFNPF